MMRICRVALDQIVSKIDRDYDYTVPDTVSGLKPGMRVLVPFGQANVLKRRWSSPYSRENRTRS